MSAREGTDLPEGISLPGTEYSGVTVPGRYSGRTGCEGGVYGTTSDGIEYEGAAGLEYSGRLYDGV